MYFKLNTIKLSKKLLLSVVATVFFFFETQAQLPENYQADIELQAIGTTNGVVPFWMRSNRFGSVPLSGASGSVIGRLSKAYSKGDANYNEQLLDWGFGFEGRANGGKNSNVQFIEAYVKGRLGIFQLKGGRSKDVVGLNVDTALSTGNFSVSGNALGIPKLEFSIPEYWRVPILDGLISIKGTFSHGWIGNLQILTNMRDTEGNLIPANDRRAVTYFHQKSLYGRLGKKDWKFSAYGGFNHQVFWGNERKIFGDDFKLSPIESFFYVATGKSYGGKTHGAVGKNLLRSKLGNHLGSVDLGVGYQFDNISVGLYRQNFYDVGALGKLANIRDGLNGVRLLNKNYVVDGKGFSWRNLIFELFYSKNQAGETWSPYTQSGDENYYNNYIYTHGWTYKGLGLGNPLITQKQDAIEGQASHPRDFYINNRVLAFHMGFESSYRSFDFLLKATYSNNYGTFATSTAGRTTGALTEPPLYGVFQKVSQSSLYLQTSKRMKNNYIGGVTVVVDQGKLLNNSAGVMLNLKKGF